MDQALMPEKRAALVRLVRKLPTLPSLLQASRPRKSHPMSSPREAEPTSANDSEVLFPSYINAGITGLDYVQDNNRLGKGGYGGLWFAKLYGAYKVTPAYKVTLQGLYIGDTTSHGDTFGMHK